MMTDEERERPTLPPAVGDEPADILIATMERLERIAGALADVSHELAIVCRDVLIIRKQQQAHGTAIETLNEWATRVDGRLDDHETRLRAVCRDVRNGPPKY